MKWFASAIMFAFVPFAASFSTEEQPPAKPEVPLIVEAAKGQQFPKEHPRGRKPTPAEVVKQRQHHSDQILQHFRNKLRAVTALTWDCRTTGQDDQVSDQAQCGDCYIHSGSGVLEDGQFTAGNAKVGTGFAISRQWFLDCHPELGGCGGGDEWQVASLALTIKVPSTTQYPGPGQSPANCGTFTGTGYQIATITYCSPSIAANGVAATADIKSWIVGNGPVSVAVAAGSSWDNYQAGQVITDPPNPNGINHAVMIIGWKTAADGKTTIWLVKNSWGSSYGDKGTLWIQENSDSIGTEAFGVGVVSTNPTPPIPPTPVPPSPTPPGPTPPPPLPGSVNTFTLTGPAVVNGTFTGEVLPTAGTNAAIQTLTAISQPVPPPVIPPLPVDPLAVRVGLLEADSKEIKASLRSIADLLGTLKKEIGK